MLAATTAKAYETFTELLAGAEKLQSNMEAVNDINVDSIKGLSDGIKLVKKSMEDLKDTLDQVS